MMPHTLFVIPADSVSWTGLLHALRQFPDLRVIGQTSDPGRAVAQVRRLTPTIILVALQAGRASVAPLVRQLRSASPDSRVMIIAEAVVDAAELARLAEARVHGHILCGGFSAEELYWTLRLSADRDMRMVSGPVLDAFLAGYERLRTLDSALRLTARQREVLTLVAAGLTYEAVGARLSIEPTTVGSHLERIRRTLSVQSREDLIATARRHGLIPAADIPQPP